MSEGKGKAIPGPPLQTERVDAIYAKVVRSTGVESEKERTKAHTLVSVSN